MSRIMIAGLAFCLIIRTAAIAGEAKPTVAGNSASVKIVVKNERSLQELVAFTIKNGDKESAPNVAFPHFGFSGDTVHMLNITYTNTVTPDKASHAFNIVYDPTIKEIIPQSLVWMKASSSKKGASNKHEFLQFLTSLDGTIISSTLSTQIDDQPNRVRLLESSEAQKLFRKEKYFFLKTAIPLKLYR